MKSGSRPGRPLAPKQLSVPQQGIIEVSNEALYSSVEQLPQLPKKAQGDTTPTAIRSPASVRKAPVSACPFVKSSPLRTSIDDGNSSASATSSNASISSTNDDVVKSFRERQAEETDLQYQRLRKECELIEENILNAESEVLKRDEESFVLAQSETELANLKQQHANDIMRKKAMFEAFMAARKERKRIKALNRTMMRETKLRDQKIQQQDLTSKVVRETQMILNQKRSALSQLVSHIEDVHEKVRKQLVTSQERQNKTETILNELQSRHLKSEIRSTVVKKHQVKMNHKRVMDKKVADHLRETQQQEMKQIKEKFEMELRGYQELSLLKTTHQEKVYELETQQSVEFNTEKERLVTIKDTLKVMQLESEHQGEMKRLMLAHKAAFRQVREAHKRKLGEAKKNRSRRSNSSSVGGSRLGSAQGSRSGSSESMFSPDAENNPFGALSDKLRDIENNDAINVDSREGLQERIEQLEASMQNLKIRHKEARQQLLLQQADELEQKEKYLAEKTREMESNHELEMIQLQKQQEMEIAELCATQEREIAMEQSIQDAECEALMERRQLNSVLDTVIDGVVCINPQGIVSRFNRAAEAMFGYSAKEVIGQNVNLLMTEDIAARHDEILATYMRTGERHVIGTGRKVFAKKKNGDVFPVHLSISEVKEDGAHLFTGIVRDMTQEDKLAEELRVAETNKQDELQALIKQLDRSKRKADELVSQMLPTTVSARLMEGIPIEPESFNSCTIMFTDIVGFTSFSSTAKPFEIVNFLNRLYSEFDSTITMYDAYKVETIGDSYMVVSGLPIANGIKHAGEMATLALHLLSKVHQFRFPDDPDRRLQIRIGLNSGPAVAGVVGSKMPRYCLFGDCVNTASRMESNGQPMKIHISQTTYDLLNEIGGFSLASRGEIQVKGKGKMKTYWLLGKSGFDEELPTMSA
ncbi:hypothetical protein HDV05_002136 [Chytridiales sp. JEL 0842]|nr:hypothetical protein HDV05_002136 [Chytridiales sp. JEL 0842]